MRFNTLLVFCACLLLPAIAIADGWEASLQVKAGRAGNGLFFGQKMEATAGIDGAYDVPAMLSGEVKAHFTTEGKKLWRDIKSLNETGKAEWDLRIESSRSGNIELNWEGAFPSGKNLRLVDATEGVTIDMQQTSSYAYANEGPRSFRIEITQ